MMRLKFLLPVATLVLFSTGSALGSDIGSHVVSLDFQQINEISVTGSPNLNISYAVAGQEPSDATDSLSTYAITTNGADKRITANLDTAVPAYVILKVNVAAPFGSGTSQGYVILSTLASDVVTGISQVADSNLTISYKLSATVQAGELSADTWTVTFTLSD